MGTNYIINMKMTKLVLPNKVMSYRLQIILLVIGNMLYGCAINDMGFAKLKLYENETAILAILETWGISLNTLPMSSGLNLGHTKHTYLYDKLENQSNSIISMDGLMNLDTERYKVDPMDENNNIIYSQKPFAMSRKNDGFSIDVNSTRIGFRIGTSNSQVVHLSDKFQWVVIMMNNSDQPENMKIHIEKGELK